MRPQRVDRALELVHLDRQTRRGEWPGAACPNEDLHRHLESEMARVLRFDDLQMVPVDHALVRLGKRGEGGGSRNELVTIAGNGRKPERRLRSDLLRPLATQAADEVAVARHVAHLPLPELERRGFLEACAGRPEQQHVRARSRSRRYEAAPAAA